MSSRSSPDRPPAPYDPYGLVGRTISRFRVLERIGGGGMGEVYLAEDTRLERNVALKLLAPAVLEDEAARTRFLQEARAASALDHPNVCTIFESGETDAGLLYIAMAYYRGRTLEERIKEGSIPVGEALHIAAQIGRGLAKAHGQGITHRDVKPANVIITEDDVVKILDFGLAKLTDLELTRTGSTPGTIAYMSPEQIQGNRVDDRADLWALGVVLYEMLAATLTFRRESGAAMLHAILTEDPPPLRERRPDVPDGVDAIVRKALAKDPAARYQSADAMVSDLVAAHEHVTRGPAETYPPSIAQRLPTYSESPAAGIGASAVAAASDLSVADSRATAPSGAAVSGSSTPSSTSFAERRQVTLVFCDLQAATDAPDPEELHEAMPAYRDACRKVAERFGGVPVPYPGEGMLLCFGYPRAHEDDARRAVRTGLAIVEAVERLNARLQPRRDVDVAIRVGIHTGLVVAEHGGDASFKLAGTAVDLATRVAAGVEQSSLVVSESTYRLVAGFFDGRALADTGARSLPLYRILHESAARNRIEAARKLPTPLIGREPEFEMLMRMWEQVTEGSGQVALLYGDAGVGKTRLVQAARDRVAKDSAAWLTECQCSPYHGNSALYPVIDVLERIVLEFRHDESNDVKLGKLEGFLVQYGFDLGETVPLFAELLSLPAGDRYAPSTLSPERKKQQTLDALVSILLQRAMEQPLLFVMEDLHWADPSTIELLELVVEQCPTARMLVVLTSRPDFHFLPAPRSFVATLSLHRLSHKEAEAVIRHVTKGKSLPVDVMAHLVEKADGIPLFLEEITRALLESGSLEEQPDRYELRGALHSLRVPATLQDSLTARLDRLGSARLTAQIGAVIGREFGFDLLRALSPHEEDVLRQDLARLIDVELVYQRGRPPRDTYVFRHALVRDAAYDTLLKSTRKDYHARIAATLTQRFADVAESQPELIARHYEAAGLLNEAVEWWSKAGGHARQRSANREAVAHMTRALELLDRLPDGPEKVRGELVLQISLGPALMAVKGYAAPEVEAAYNRARELCREIGETPELVAVLFGLWAFYVVRGSLGTARDTAEQILRLVALIDDSGVRLEAHVALGVTLYFLGEFPAAREHLEEAVAIYDPDEHASHAASFGQDPGMASRIYLAKTLSIMGHAQSAARLRQEAIDVADRLGHAHTSAFCLSYAALVSQFEGNAGETRALAERTRDLADEHGFPVWGALASVLHGWARAHGPAGDGVPSVRHDPAGSPDDPAALDELRSAITAWQSTGTGLYTPYWLALLAEVQMLGGDVTGALESLDEAIRSEENGEERVVLAELYRRKALITLAADPTAVAQSEAWLEKALSMAESQSAAAWTLRAAVDLARVQRHTGREALARDLLARTIEHFPERAATRDFHEAIELLGELSP